MVECSPLLHKALSSNSGTAKIQSCLPPRGLSNVDSGPQGDSGPEVHDSAKERPAASSHSQYPSIRRGSISLNQSRLLGQPHEVIGILHIPGKQGLLHTQGCIPVGELFLLQVPWTWQAEYRLYVQPDPGMWPHSRFNKMSTWLLAVTWGPCGGERAGPCSQQLPQGKG